MIEILKGKHEIVRFEEGAVVKLHDNDESECYPMHWHLPIEIIMPVENNYVIRCLDSMYDLREGDVLVVQPGVLHECIAPEHGRRYFCQVVTPPPLTNGRAQTALSLQLPSVMLITPEVDAPLHQSVRGLLEHAYAVKNHPMNGLLAEYDVYLSMLEVIRQVYTYFEKRPESQTEGMARRAEVTVALQKACDFICQSYGEPISLEDAARVAGFSKFHFTRLFKTYMGETFNHYLNAVRMSNARVLLSKADASITQTAYQVGYASMSSFIRMFKSFHGCTPSEYRRLVEGR